MRARMVAGALCLAGSAAAAAAIFAQELGLDPSPGWGAARIALMATGLALVIVGTAWVRIGASASAAAGSMAAGLERRFPGPYDASRRTARRLWQAAREYLPVVPLVVSVLAGYVWFASSGTWTDLDSPTRYYADLARGFARGNLYLPVRPDPHLLTAANPYEPSPSGAPPGPLDLSYHDGRFYLYWGPVPALVLLVARPLVPWRVGDLQLSLLLAAGTYLLLCAFLLKAWNRWFSPLPKSLLWVSLLAAGWAGPVTFMLNNHQGARIYEASILGGQFFLLAGVLSASRAAEGRPSPGWLLLASGLWALAVGTRLSLTIPVGVLALLTIVWIVRARWQPGRRALMVIAVATPLALAAICLGWYNWARFGSITQTGQIYQLTGFMDLRKYQDQFLSPLYAPQNAYNYLLNPPTVGQDFPYLHVNPVATQPLLGANLLPELYGGQQITGFLYTVPFVALALLPITRLRGPWAPREAGDRPEAYGDRRLWMGMVLGLSAACAATFASLLIYFWTAMRFLADFMPMLMLLSSLGFWMGYKELRSRRIVGPLFVVLGALLSAISIINSTLIAISINNARFAISEWLARGF